MKYYIYYIMINHEKFKKKSSSLVYLYFTDLHALLYNQNKINHFFPIFSSFFLIE